MRVDDARPSTRALFNRVDGSQVALLSDLAAEQIRRLIDSGQLAAGAQLPSERELALQLGVSRTALREALRILEASGVLEARVGRGRYVSVSRRDERQGGIDTRWLEAHYEELAELNHVLQLVEPAGVLEIPAHLVPHVAGEAHAICARMEVAITAGDAEQAAELDGVFHQTLTRVTPNRILRELIANLIAASAESARVVYRIPRAARHSLEEHWAITRALEAGSREEASRLLREHAAVAYRFAVEHATDST